MKVPMIVDATKINDTILYKNQLYVMTVVDTSKKIFTATKVKNKVPKTLAPGTQVDVLPLAPGAAVLAFPIP